MGKVSLLCLSLLLLAGCAHYPLPNLPDDFKASVVSKDVLEDKPDVASMQVLIMYGAIVCNHTALRLHCPSKGVLFWDPGGGYATEGFVKTKRYKNVIRDNPPTVNDYMHWRTLIPTSSSEIFVWEGQTHEICKLYDYIDKASLQGRYNGFKTQTPGLFCSTAVSNFLQDKAQSFINVEGAFFPHNLSKKLHEEKSADNVYIVDHANDTVRVLH